VELGPPGGGTGLVAPLARNLYITAMGPQSGKSVVALGLMELLSARTDRVGFFRPLVGTDSPDEQLELVRARYAIGTPIEEMSAMTDAEAQELIAAGDREEVEKQVVAAYRAIEAQHDIVVCEGTDFTGATPALDFGLNAQLANGLGCPVLAVVTAGDAGSAEAAARVAREALDERGCELFGVVVNRVPASDVNDVRERLAAAPGEAPVLVLPEWPALARPTVAEVATALGATPVTDGDSGHGREVADVRIAAMSVAHFIDDLADGTLVIAPGDRADIVVASLAVTRAADFPAVAGIVLTAGYELDPAMRRLLADSPFPVFETGERTYSAATAVSGVRAALSARSERKVATALSLFASAVDPEEIGERLAVERPRRMTPVMFEYELVERARADRRHIVLPEGEDDRVLEAADILLRRDVVDLTILGDPDEIGPRASALGLDLGAAQVVNPLTSPLRERFAGVYHDLRKHKGVTEELALETAGDVTYFATLMVREDEADALVSGAAHTTGDTIRPAFEVIKARPGVSVVSSVFLMCLADRVLVYGDCAVNPKPDVEQLADIAISSAETAAAFSVEPRIAMLSYSTGESGKGEDVDAVRAATALARERRADLKIEGPIQYDAAVDSAVAQKKLPDSEVAGQATVFVFPDLETGNIAYKAVQRSAGAVAIGPVLQGLRKPVNDLSRGCTVTDIVNTVIVTAIQAQESSGRSTSRLALAAPAG
jgi:phosphate acetyltransferase